MQSSDRKGIAQIQRIGAFSDRKSRATFSEHTLTCDQRNISGCPGKANEGISGQHIILTIAAVSLPSVATTLTVSLFIEARYHLKLSWRFVTGIFSDARHGRSISAHHNSGSVNFLRALSESVLCLRGREIETLKGGLPCQGPRADKEGSAPDADACNSFELPQGRYRLRPEIRHRFRPRIRCFGHLASRSSPFAALVVDYDRWLVFRGSIAFPSFIGPAQPRLVQIGPRFEQNCQPNRHGRVVFWRPRPHRLVSSQEGYEPTEPKARPERNNLLDRAQSSGSRTQ